MPVINQTYIEVSRYAGTPIHKYLTVLIPLLEYRQEVADRVLHSSSKDDYVVVLEYCNKKIMDVLGIPTESIQSNKQ